MAQQPPQPSYILRGHTSPVHALCLLRENCRLLSGDAEGWVVLWHMVTKRPAAVWQAHKSTILGIASWGTDKIITHGRDNKLHVWNLAQSDEDALSKRLPADTDVSERRDPWLLHSIPVNTITFCSFAACSRDVDESAPSRLVAVPSADEGSVLIYQLPDETLHSMVTAGTREKTGMLMALCMTNTAGSLTLAAAFEIGLVFVWRFDLSGRKWSKIVESKVHTQPALSVSIAPDISAVFSSSADALIVKYPLDGTNETSTATKHAGQQALQVRSDGRMLATAGWDGRARIYSTQSLKEVAVLKWHKEGCYALAFADITPSPDAAEGSSTELAKTESSVTVASKRQSKVQSTHWLALGSKDGKISLWDVF